MPFCRCDRKQYRSRRGLRSIGKLSWRGIRRGGRIGRQFRRYRRRRRSSSSCTWLDWFAGTTSRLLSACCTLSGTIRSRRCSCGLARRRDLGDERSYGLQNTSLHVSILLTNARIGGRAAFSGQDGRSAGRLNDDNDAERAGGLGPTRFGVPNGP